MKKRLAIVNFALIAAILSSIVFQSVHSFEHLVASYSEKHCVHPHETDEPQVTHEHHRSDHCFTCEFSFSGFVTPEIFTYQFFSAQKAIPYFFTANETPECFSGISYSLRGPPVV